MGEVTAKRLKFSDLVFLEDNPRTITADDLQRLAGRIKDDPTFFDNRPCLVNFTGGKYLCYAGFQRSHAAAKILKWKDVPCMVENDVPSEVMRKRAILDNTHDGKWDADVLSSWEFEVEEFRDMGVPEWVFGGDGEDEDEVKLEVKEDEYEPPAEIITDIVPGDLFEIGRHRLICGDSTHADTVARLLDGEKPFLMVTDPPYGVEYDPEWRAEAGVNKNKEKMGRVKNDDRADWRESYSLSQCKVAYVWHANRHAKTVQESIEVCGFVVRNQIIWAKDRFALSRGNYHWQHEPCWYAVQKGENAKFIGERNNSTLWSINSREDGGHGHGTQKPVECMARPIRNHDGDVYDPFGGSGTTMVASHQLNRRCFMAELMPQYCQITIDRMIKLDPTLEIKRNGQPYQK